MTATARCIAGIVLTIGTSAALAQQTTRTTFQDTSGKQIGSAILTQTPGGILIDVDIAGLPPGERGFHLHETGRCDAADGFKSAGSHFSPQKRQHGHHVKGGPHAGDMPNQFVASDGRLRAHVLNSRVTLASGANTLLDKDGSALVVHAKPDDYRSQPSGDAGDRIACAVIERPGK